MLDTILLLIAIALIICICLGFASNLPALMKAYSSSYWHVNCQVLKAVKKMGKDFGNTPLARAAKGKHTKGFI